MMLSDKIKLYSGISIILMLAIMNVFAYTDNIDLSNSEIRNSPPSIKIFQRLLYKVDFQEEAVHDIFADISETDEKILLFSNRPNFTAVTGSKFIYRPVGMHLKSNVNYNVDNAPPGFIFNGKYYEWTPESNQAGIHNITLTGEYDSGRVIRDVNFILYVDNRNNYLGTDNRGRNVLALLIAGSKWALLPGIVASIIAVFGGMVLGAISGYFNNWLTRVLESISTIIESIPALFLIFLAAVISEFNIYSIMIAVGLVVLPSVMNNIKTIVNNFVQNEFVESSKEIGFSNSTILWRDIIWSNCRPTLINHIAACLAFSIVIEVTLGYLGIGIQPPDISWGSLLNEGKSRLLNGNYWLIFFPSIMIVITLFGFFNTGEILSKTQNPRFKAQNGDNAISE